MAAHSVAARDAGLRLDLQSGKQLFSSKEDIVVTVTLTNTTAHEWYLNHWYENVEAIGQVSDFRFKVVRGGEEAERKYIHWEQRADMYVPFQVRHVSVGEIIRLKVTLNHWYDMSEDGRYSVACTYSLKGPFERREKLPMWEGTLQSSQIEFEINK
jgi:hypothetical protein